MREVQCLRESSINKLDTSSNFLLLEKSAKREYMQEIYTSEEGGKAVGRLENRGRVSWVWENQDMAIVLSRFTVYS